MECATFDLILNLHLQYLLRDLDELRINSLVDMVVLYTRNIYYENNSV